MTRARSDRRSRGVVVFTFLFVFGSIAGMGGYLYGVQQSLNVLDFNFGAHTISFHLNG